MSFSLDNFLARLRSVNFLKFLREMQKDNPADDSSCIKGSASANGIGPNFEVGLYEINHQTDNDMQQRLLIGTSAWPIDKIFEPNKVYDLESEQRYSDSCLLGKLNKDKPLPERDKVRIPGYQLVSKQDNRQHEYSRGETQHPLTIQKLRFLSSANIFDELKKIWKKNLRPAAGSPESLTLSAPHSTHWEWWSGAKSTQIHYAAAINGGRVFGRFLKRKDPDNNDLHFIKPVWHDPLWIPEKNEVIAITIPSGFCEFGDELYNIIKDPESYGENLINARLSLYRTFSNWQMQIAIDMLYEGQAGAAVDERIRQEWVPREVAIESWGKIAEQHQVYGAIQMIGNDPNRLLHSGASAIACKINQSYEGAPYQGPLYPTWPRYTGILRKISTFDKSESDYNSDAENEYGEHVANKKNHFFENLTENNSWREYMDAIQILTRQTFFKFFIDSKCKFVESNLYGEHQIPKEELNQVEGTQWISSRADELSLGADDLSAKEYAERLFMGVLNLWSPLPDGSKGEEYVAEGFCTTKGDSPYPHNKVAYSTAESVMKQYSDRKIKPTRVGKFVELCKRCNHVQRGGLEFINLLFTKCVSNSNINRWNEFWKKRKENNDYSEHGV